MVVLPEQSLNLLQTQNRSERDQRWLTTWFHCRTFNR
ncbi:hypothetical protein V6Z12_A03G015600 [Gossypium hirsutum]